MTPQRDGTRFYPGASDPMKRVLVVHYSQSGQLTEIVRSFVGQLHRGKRIDLVWEELQPVHPYPFPWPFFRFMDVFPESVCMYPPQMRPFSFDPATRFDLIILAYQVWFLAPSLPVTGFLKSPEAMVMNGVPVITVVNCKDRWLMAQERVKECIKQLGGKLIDNVVLFQKGNPVTVLVSTLRWLWTGKKDGFWKVFPRAGVSDHEIRGCERFGKAIAQALETGKVAGGHPVLKGLGAVEVDPKIIKQEQVGYSHFLFWGKMLRRVGKQGEWRRIPFLFLFMVYLGCLLLISLPVDLIFKLAINPFRRRALQEEIEYYEQPSGSSRDRL